VRNWVLAALLLGSACKSSETESKAPKGETAPTATVTPSDAAIAVGQKPLRYKVDGEHVEVASMGADFALLDVAELPPIADWKTLIIRSVDGREFTGTKPILLTGIRTMRVVTLPSGAWEFRVMEQVPSEGNAAPKPPRIRHKMTDAKSVIIYTNGYEPPKPKDPVSELTLTSGDTTATLDNTEMDAVERSPEPGQREARDTWTLDSLLSAAKLSAKAGIRLTDQAGKTHDLSSEELANQSSVHIVKRNRRGLFNYRHWTLGPPPKRTHDMRGIVSIELL
jgi:hypothetical protein